MLKVIFMAYKALYRTYRPQTFEEVAGQRHIVRTLKNALEKNKIAHAYLFCGPRGTGKTTMAKLFAKALNCEEGIGHQCNNCENCKEIIAGTHPDVIEIDAASNNGVEQVRDLIDKVNYLPIKGKYKVYIIDEVHMMTTNAFNALLKTLEEPPAHVIFILATTEPHNILPTIISRCQRYDFEKVADSDIKERMLEIMNQENISYEDSAVDRIISLADGGVRDALSILDQALAYSGDSLYEEDIINMFGLTSTSEKVQFIKDIRDGDITMALDKLKSFSEGGVDLKRLNNDLLEILKDILIYKKTREQMELTVLDEQNAIELADSMDIRTINQLITGFLKAQTDFKTVSNIYTMFEINILKLCTLGDVVETDPSPRPAPRPVVKPEPKPIENLEKPIGTQAFETKVTEKEETKPIVEEIKPEPKKEETKIMEPPDWLFDDSNEKKELNNDGDVYELNDDLIVNLMVCGDKDARKNLVNKWGTLSQFVGHPTLGDIVALAKDGKPFLVTKNVVVLEYDLGTMAKKLNIKSNQDKISSLVRKIMDVEDVFVYAISRSDGVRLIRTFQNLRQISKLPRPSEVKIDIEEIKKL